MTTLSWNTTKVISFGKYTIPCSEQIYNSKNVDKCVRRDSLIKYFFKFLFWSFVELKLDFFVDGFIKNITAKWIKEFYNDKCVFLEIGCGNMPMIKRLPKHIIYNAFDISFSEFNLRRVLKNRRMKINLAVSSIENIPLDENVVSLFLSNEVLFYIQDIESAIREIYRIAKPGAKLICSIPNNFCYKYSIKGPHALNINYWTYNSFVDFMDSYNFRLLKGVQKGYWIPFPLWITKTSYQLPITSKNEHFNTNFMFVFEVRK